MEEYMELYLPYLVFYFLTFSSQNLSLLLMLMIQVIYLHFS